MKTTLDITTILFQLLNSSPIKTAINGGIYKDNRPANSTKEDVVVNAITIDADNAQRAAGNVNIHVPSINTSDGPQPNHGRLSSLATITVGVIKEAYGEAYNLWVENQNLIKEPNADSWYVNFRIRFKFHNTPII